MAMDWRTLSLPLTRGADPAHDSKLLEMGRLQRLDNAVFSTTGSIQKAGGYTDLDLTARSGTNPTTLRNVAAQGDNLVIDADQGLYVGQNKTTWLESNFTRAVVERKQISALPGNPTAVDTCELGGRRHVAVVDGYNGLLLYSWDVSSTGEMTAVRTAEVVSATATYCKLVSDGTSVWLIYADSSGGTGYIYTKKVDSGGYGLGTRYALTSGAGIAGPLDATYSSANTRVYLSLYDGTVFRFGYFDIASPGSGMALAGAGSYAVSGYSAICVSGSYVFTAYARTGGNGVRMRVTGLDCTTGATESSIATGTYGYGISLVSLGSGDCKLFYTTGASTAATDMVSKAATYSSALAVTGTAQTYYGYRWVSRGVLISSKTYAWAVYSDVTDARTVFLRGENAADDVSAPNTYSERAVAAVFNGCGFSGPDAMPSVVASYYTSYWFCPLARVASQTDAAHLTYSLENVGVSLLATGTFYDLEVLGSCSTGKLAMFAASVPFVFDGATLFSGGFQNAPSLKFNASSGASGIDAGTYQYTAVFEYVDASGKRWLSGSGVPITVTLAGAKGQVDINVYAPLQADRMRSCSVLLYRTEASGVVFYLAKVAAVTYPGGVVTVSDTTTNASLIGQPVVYTTGGVLDNEPWPGCRHIIRHQDRFWFVGLDDPYLLQYTDEEDEQYAPATNQYYQVRVPSTLGVICTAASVGDRLLILCERGAWVLSGEGLDRTGQNSTFQPLMQFPTVAGAVKHRAPCALMTREGVWYRSGEGIRCIGPDFQMVVDEQGRPLGSDVDTYASDLRAIIQHPTNGRVQFSCSADVLVWDQAFRQWSRFAGVLERGATVLGSTVYGASFIAVHTHGGTSRNGSGFSMVIDTGWLKFAGVQGFQRLQQALLLGTNPGTTSETTLLEVAYDYSDSFATEATYSVPDAPGPVQSRWLLARQKCTAARFRFTTAASTNQIAYSDLAFVVGLKRGGSKLPAAQSVG